VPLQSVVASDEAVVVVAAVNGGGGAGVSWPDEGVERLQGALEREVGEEGWIVGGAWLTDGCWTLQSPLACCKG
jgi:hypothetical protein